MYGDAFLRAKPSVCASGPSCLAAPASDACACELVAPCDAFSGATAPLALFSLPIVQTFPSLDLPMNPIQKTFLAYLFSHNTNLIFLRASVLLT